jgi:hypothetical protein
MRADGVCEQRTRVDEVGQESRLYYIASSAHLKRGLNATERDGFTLLYHVPNYLYTIVSIQIYAMHTLQH